MENGKSALGYRIHAVGVGLVFALLSIFAGCSDKQKNGPDDITVDKFNVPVSEVNQWITGNMREVYYWNTSIPNNNQLDFATKQPDKFFEGILFSGDRFSWIEEADKLQDGLAGVSTTVGLGIQLISLVDNSIIMSITYAHKGSPAERAGLKRGDIVTRINGKPMTTSDYQSTMEPYYGQQTFTMRLAKLNGSSLVEDKEVQLTPVTNFQESAILLDTILTTPSGKKVAYLFYNRFLNNQVNELMAVFNKFKQAQVDELVLDMRYNGGGGIFIAGVLSSLIYEGFDEADLFVKYKYNSNYPDVDYSFYRLFGGLSQDQAEKENADLIVGLAKTLNLGLDRVFTLATNRSASASELVINNLRPFMGNQNVVHIGRTTLGKNQGSITIVDESKPRKIHWGMQPIVILLANKNSEGDYYNGLLPQFELNENSVLPYKPLGDPTDPLLAKALSVIDPALQAKYNLMMRAGKKSSEELMIREVVGFEDPYNKARTVELGNTLNY